MDEVKIAQGLEMLSLVIVTWNGDEVLRKCLESVLRVYGSLPETVVVDNAGQDVWVD